MSITIYRTGYDWRDIHHVPIKAIEVEKVTDCTVTINGRRQKRMSRGQCCYFDSFEKAKN